MPIPKPFLWGVLVGGCLLQALSAMTAQRSFSIPQVMSEASKFWGNEATVEGLARSVRLSYRSIKGQQIQYASFFLYEPSGDPKYPFGKHSISVTLPASNLRYQPQEGQAFAVTGKLEAPGTIATINGN